MAVSLLVVTAVAGAFIQMIRTSDAVEAQVRASNTARLAVDRIAKDLGQVLDPGNARIFRLEIVDRPLTYGDFIDSDRDGTVDEEIYDGIDNDSDWTSTDDRHASTPFGLERPAFVGVADQGDDSVDIDCRFSADAITFTLAASQTSTGRLQRVTYSLGTFEGVDNVLLKTVNDGFNTTSNTLTVEPLVFDVVSLDVLAWDINNDAPTPVANAPYWRTEWVSDDKQSPLRPINAPVGVPPFRVPGAFLISVVANAESAPLSEIRDWPAGRRELRTVRVTTVVNAESVISSNRYSEFVRLNP